MANRVLLLLALASRNHPSSSSKILSETASMHSFLFDLQSLSLSLLFIAFFEVNFTDIYFMIFTLYIV